MLFLVGITLSVIVASSSRVQTFLYEYFVPKMSPEFNRMVHVGNIKYIFPRKIKLTDIHITDTNGVDIFYVHQAVTKIKRISLNDSHFRFGNSTLDSVHVFMNIDKNDNFNVKPFFAMFQSKDTLPRQRMLLEFGEIAITKATFLYYIEGKQQRVDEKFNPANIDVKNINANIHKLVVSRDGVTSIDIENLSGIEASGLKINYLRTNLKVSSQQLTFGNLKILTENSSLFANVLSFNHQSWDEWKNGGFYIHPNIKFDLKQAHINLIDLSYFVPKLPKHNQFFKLSCKLDGTFDNLKIKNIHLKYGQNTYFQGDCDMSGLPNIATTFFHQKIKALRVDYNDFIAFDLNALSHSEIKLPEFLKGINYITYKGNFTGFIDDFVAFGNFTTPIGNISSDILIKPNASKGIYFSGKLNSKHFEIQKLIDNNTISNVAFDVSLNGELSENKDISSIIDGNISALTFNSYQYTGISFTGSVNNKAYKGEIAIRDPNLAFDFAGNMDFTDNLPRFDCRASISSANLYALHIDKSDSLSKLQCSVIANFYPYDTNDFKGLLKFSNIKYEKTNKTLRLKNLDIISSIIGEKESILIESDYISGKLDGSYDFPSLKNSMKGLVNSYLPSYFKDFTPSVNQKNVFNLSLNLKKTGEIISFFYPDIYVADSTTIQINENSQLNILSVKLMSNQIKYKSNVFQNIDLESSNQGTNYHVELKADGVKLQNKMEFKNLVADSYIRSDSIDFSLVWDNQSLINNKGNIHFITHLGRVPNYNKPVYKIDISPSSVTNNDAQWLISKSKVVIEKKRITVDNISIINDLHHLVLNGAISHNPLDKLNIELKNIDLSGINFLIPTDAFKFDGNVNGNAVFSGFYGDMSLLADLKIDSLKLNKELIGNAVIRSAWQGNEDQLLIDLNVFRGQLNTLTLTGNYAPKNNELCVSGNLNKFRLTPLTPILKTIMSDVDGVASGDVSLNGELRNLMLNGALNVQRASFKINYLNTSFSFTDKINIVNNKLIFDNITLSDENGERGHVNGSLSFPRFRDLLFNIYVDVNNMKVLNTTSQSKNGFYGVGFASGKAHFAGNAQDISMDISLKAERRSEIMIPLSSGELKEKNFIRFRAKEEFTENTNIVEFKANTNTTINQDTTEKTLLLNLDVAVSPEVKARILFESGIADELKAKGEGNIRIALNKQGVFTMYGEYTINEGEFLINLQNIISRKFNISAGSKLSWNGAPDDIMVDLTAKYNTRTSLSSLFGDTSNVYRKRIPVECNIYLKGNLLSPVITFGIFAPTIDSETQNRIAFLLNTEEKRSRQFMSLLVMNSFFFEADAGAGSAPGASPVQGLGTASGTEMLTNQLSSLLNNISNGFDVGVYYRPANEAVANQFEVALSTQVLNDRVSISGNVDVNNDQNQARNPTNSTSNIVGNFEVDVKINERGTLRAKAFNRENDNLLYGSSLYKQGVGVAYKEEFNTFNELMKRYWEKVMPSKKQ